jgi:hypothetical protein
MIPTYRQVMEDELAPIIDEVNSILAVTAVQTMVAAAKTGEIDESMAMEEAAAAVVTRLDTLFVEALNEPAEENGPSPQDAIDAALGQLKTIDRGLARHASGRGDANERELLLAWISLLSQVEEDAQTAASESHNVGVDVKD